MGISTGGAFIAASLCLALFLIYKKMARAGSPFFKIGYCLYTKTRVGYVYYRREVSKAQRKYNNEGHSITKTTSFNGLKIIPVALSLDNYCYFIADMRSGVCVLVDPADPDPVQQIIDREKVKPIAVLTTHKHWDHSGGNKVWKSRYRGIRIFGCSVDGVPGATEQVVDGDKIELGQLIFDVHFTPGHTVGHVVYVLDGTTFGAPPSLFSGDHLFLGGIGRMFEGPATTMLRSLDTVSNLPEETLIWPGHEYAEDNLEFALTIEPDNQDLQEKYRWVQEKRKQRECTCPSTLAEEKLYNPFLRVHTDSILQTLGIEKDGQSITDQTRGEALAECRARKDKFKYKL